MTLGKWLETAGARLAASGSPDPVTDACWIACEVTGWARSSLRLRGAEKLDGSAVDRLDAFLARRLTGEPLEYALGSAYFMGLRFKCDSRALIPRPETETLTEAAIGFLKAKNCPKALDMCCGTGAIGLSIAKLVPGAEVVLSDLSADALSLARDNAQSLGCGSVSFARGDLFEAVGGAAFDLIACNPPYLDARDMACLQKEVHFEPEMALFGGEDGLSFYRRLAAEGKSHLLPGGVMMMEIGMGQDDPVRALFAGWSGMRFLKDLQGIPRVAIATP